MKPAKDTQDMAGKGDFRIDREGRWYHDGGLIGRKALAKLFSDRALKIDEEGKYWLQTPFEKYPVEVEDVPYVIVDFIDENGALDFITNMEERVELGPENPIELRDFDGQKLPYIHVRNGLYARLNRNVYYALVHKYGEKVSSRGAEFPLGEVS